MLPRPRFSWGGNAEQKQCQQNHGRKQSGNIIGSADDKGQKTTAQKEKYSFGTLFFFYIQEKQSEEKQHAAVHERIVAGLRCTVKGRFSFVNHMDARETRAPGKASAAGFGKAEYNG